MSRLLLRDIISSAPGKYPSEQEYLTICPSGWFTYHTEGYFKNFAGLSIFSALLARCQVKQYKPGTSAGKWPRTPVLSGFMIPVLMRFKNGRNEFFHLLKHAS